MQAYIERIKTLEVDTDVSRKFLQSDTDLSQKYLVGLIHSKLVGSSVGMNSDPIEMIDLTNVILDNLDLQKTYQSEHGGSNLVDEVV